MPSRSIVPGLEVLDDRVGVLHQPQQVRAALVGLEVEHDAALVGVEEQEEAGALDVPGSSWWKGGVWRVGSPSGGSILITSAP